MSKSIRVIIPAAGKGTRLNCTDTPKAMYRMLDKPLLGYVLENTSFIDKKNTYIIVGYEKEKIIDHFGNGYNYVLQKNQFGTGHAVEMCRDAFRDFDGTVLVTFGDMPLFGKDILEKICDHHIKTNAACTLLTAEDESIGDWAHITRDQNGNLTGIVEAADLDESDKDNKELFAGVLVFESVPLFEMLPNLNKENAQGEYYLTELPALFAKNGLKIEVLKTEDPDDLRGINTPQDAKICEQIIKKRMSL